METPEKPQDVEFSKSYKPQSLLATRLYEQPRTVEVNLSALCYLLGWASDKARPDLVDRAVEQIRLDMVNGAGMYP